MPDRSEKLGRLNEEADEYELPYISKSRLMSWVKNPEHFRLKYLEGIREPENDAMVRGRRIHETFEYYYNARAEVPSVTMFDSQTLPEERALWADFVEPYLTNFALWEKRRWEAAGRDPDKFLPIGIEEEAWNDDIIDAGPEWMGLADVLLPAASVPEVPTDDGVVVVDFKTGKVPQEKYRGDGIYMELAYYEMLFEDEYDIVGGAAYYPKADRLLVRPPQGHRKDVLEAGEELVDACAEYEGDMKFRTNEGPLCKWGFGDDEESAFYGICSQCSWGAPAKNENAFRQMVDEGYSAREIADELGCSPNAAQYWRHKL